MNKIHLVPILSLMMLSLLTFNTQAKMYKWVDEEGNTHYTQSPPPEGLSGETIKPPPPAPTQPDKQQDKTKNSLLDKSDKKQQEDDSDEGLTDAEYDKQAIKVCESAKKSFQSFQRNRVNLKNPDGSVRVATEEERQAGLAKAQAAIKEYCK